MRALGSILWGLWNLTQRQFSISIQRPQFQNVPNSESFWALTWCHKWKVHLMSCDGLQSEHTHTENTTLTYPWAVWIRYYMKQKWSLCLDLDSTLKISDVYVNTSKSEKKIPNPNTSGPRYFLKIYFYLFESPTLGVRERKRFSTCWFIPQRHQPPQLPGWSREAGTSSGSHTWMSEPRNVSHFLLPFHIHKQQAGSELEQLRRKLMLQTGMLDHKQQLNPQYWPLTEGETVQVYFPDLYRKSYFQIWKGLT